MNLKTPPQPILSPAGLSIVVILFLLGASTAVAQTTTLVFPVNARTNGMGLTGTADNSDPSGIYFNPANVVGRERVYLVGSNERFEDIGEISIALRRIDGGGCWKFNESSAWTFGANAAFATLDLEEGSFGDLSEDLMSLAFGASVFARNRMELRIGAAIKRVSFEAPTIDSDFNIVQMEADGIAYDWGIAFAIHGDETRWNFTPHVAVANTDLGSDIEFPDGASVDLPTRFNLGTSMQVRSPLQTLGWARVPFFAAIVNFDGRMPDEGDDSWAFGAEIAVAQIMFMRGGTLIRHDEDDEAGFGFGVGIPLQSFRFRFDYGIPGSDFIKDEMSLLAAWEF